MRRHRLHSTPAAVSSEPAGASGTPASSAPAASTLSGKVTTGGSTSVEKVVGAFIEAFMAENSGVDVTYDPTGSRRGHHRCRPREPWTSAFPAVR